MTYSWCNFVPWSLGGKKKLFGVDSTFVPFQRFGNYLTGLPSDRNNIDSLAKKLSSLRNENDRNRAAEKKAYDRLLDPDFADDKTIKELIFPGQD